MTNNNVTVVNIRRNSRDQFVAGVKNSLSWDDALDLVTDWASENGLVVSVTALEYPPEVGTKTATGNLLKRQNHFYVYNGSELLMEAQRKEVLGVQVEGVPTLTL